VDLDKAVKMGWNPQAEPVHHGFRSGWVEIFLQISIRVDFWLGSFRTRLTRVEPVVSRVWAGLAHQPVHKRVTQVFFIFFLSWALHLGHVRLFFYPTHKWLKNRGITLFLPLSLHPGWLEGEGHDDIKWIRVWNLCCSL